MTDCENGGKILILITVLWQRGQVKHQLHTERRRVEPAKKCAMILTCVTMVSLLICVLFDLSEKKGNKVNQRERVTELTEVTQNTQAHPHPEAHPHALELGKC